MSESRTTGPAFHSCYPSNNVAALITVPFAASSFAGSAIIDSASTINIVNQSLVSSACLQVISSSNPVTIIGISADDTKSVGHVSVKGHIRDIPVSFRAHVVPDFSHHVLLGLPYIMRTPVDIVPSSKCVRIKHQTFPIQPDFFENVARPVRLLCNVNIPPHHEIVAPVEIAQHASSSPLCTPPILAFPDFVKDLILSTDAAGQWIVRSRQSVTGIRSSARPGRHEYQSGLGGTAPPIPTRNRLNSDMKQTEEISEPRRRGRAQLYIRLPLDSGMAQQGQGSCRSPKNERIRSF